MKNAEKIFIEEEEGLLCYKAKALLLPLCACMKDKAPCDGFDKSLRRGRNCTRSKIGSTIGSGGCFSVVCSGLTGGMRGIVWCELAATPSVPSGCYV